MEGESGQGRKGERGLGRGGMEGEKGSEQLVSWTDLGTVG